MELYIDIFVGFCMFVIGTLFGSFFSLATYRLPRHQDILVKRSYCPNCNHNLGFFDLIPILSYIFCVGKCRYCKDKISIRYFLLEITNGIVFLLFFLIFGYTINLLIVSLVYAISFVLIGSYIMQSKMSEQELKNIKNLKSKKGVYISEIVIAMILFTLLLVSSYVVSRNYNKNSVETLARSGAVELAVKNIEMAKLTEYDSLSSYNFGVEENNLKYSVNIEVIPFNEINSTYEDIGKKIVVTVSYNIEGNPYEYSLSTLKGKVST